MAGMVRKDNVGIVMGASGTDVAIEAVHIALMREDWSRFRIWASWEIHPGCFVKSNPVYDTII